MSEFRRFGTGRIGDQVTQNDGNSREKMVFSTGNQHFIGFWRMSTKNLVTKNLYWVLFYLEWKCFTEFLLTTIKWQLLVLDCICFVSCICTIVKLKCIFHNYGWSVLICHFVGMLTLICLHAHHHLNNLLLIWNIPIFFI